MSAERSRLHRRRFPVPTVPPPPVAVVECVEDILLSVEKSQERPVPVKISRDMKIHRLPRLEILIAEEALYQEKRRRFRITNMDVLNKIRDRYAAEKKKLDELRISMEEKKKIHHEMKSKMPDDMSKEQLNMLEKASMEKKVAKDDYNAAKKCFVEVPPVFPYPTSAWPTSDCHLYPYVR